MCAESGCHVQAWLSCANPLNDCACRTITCLMRANKIAFAFELACLPLNWLLDKKCWLAKNSLFGKNYCGGVSHSNRKTVKVDLCPTIVGPKFTILASDTKSISEACQKLSKTEKAVCLIVAQNLLVVQTTIVLESERQQASLDCPALKLMMSYVSIQASCSLARV